MKPRTKAIIYSLAVVAVALLSYFTNMGMLRAILALFLAPFISAVIVIVLNLISVKYFKQERLIKITNILFNISYLLSNFFFPDAITDSDIPSFMFFGLIKSGRLYTPFLYASIFFFACFVILIALQIFLLLLNRKKA